MYLKKKIAFRVFAFRKTPKRKKTRKNVILKLHFPDATMMGYKNIFIREIRYAK